MYGNPVQQNTEWGFFIGLTNNLMKSTSFKEIMRFYKKVPKSILISE